MSDRQQTTSERSSQTTGERLQGTSDRSQYGQGSEHARRTTDRPQSETMIGDVAEGASGGIVTVIDATEDVFEEVVHAVGRLSTAVIEEIFGILGAAVGGAGAMFRGGRITTRRRDQESRQDYGYERRGEQRSTASGSATGTTI